MTKGLSYFKLKNSTYELYNRTLCKKKKERKITFLFFASGSASLFMRIQTDFAQHFYTLA